MGILGELEALVVLGGIGAVAYLVYTNWETLHNAWCGIPGACPDPSLGLSKTTAQVLPETKPVFYQDTFVPASALPETTPVYYDAEFSFWTTDVTCNGFQWIMNGGKCV